MTLILQMASLSHQVVGEPHERNRKWVRVNFQKSQFWAHDSWDGRPTQKESQHTCSCRRPPSLEPTNDWKQHVLTYGSIVGWLASKNHGDQPPVRVDICHRPQYAHTHYPCTTCVPFRRQWANLTAIPQAKNKLMHWRNHVRKRSEI